MATPMLAGKGRWGFERQDRAQAQATGEYEPVTEVVYQGQQEPPKAEDYDTSGPDGLAVRKPRGSRMFL